MMRVSLLSIFVTVALAALLFGMFASIQNSSKLAAQRESLRAKLESRNREFEQLADKHAAEVELLHKSTKLLARIHESPDHSDIVAFIAEMKGSSLPCSVRYFPKSDNRAVFVYHEPYDDSRLAARRVTQRRSVQLLADTETLSIVDSVMHVGYRSESITESAGSDPVWKTHYEFADGRKITYRVTPSGFEELK